MFLLKKGEMTWRNIKPLIKNQATLRHSMANFPSFLLHKLFLIYVLEFFTNLIPIFEKIGDNVCEEF